MKEYKIVRIAGIHSQLAIHSHYSRNPHLLSASYSDQQQALFDYAYMYSDTFSKEMRKIGHSANEILYDVEILQKTWASEHGLVIHSKNWQIEILLAQLAHLKPEIVFFQDIHSLPYELKISLKTRIPSIKKIVIFRGYPGTDSRLLAEFAIADLILVGSPVLLKKCREKNLKSYLVYHSFDKSLLHKLKNRKASPEINFSFIGSSGFGYGKGHQERYWMLYSLLKQTEIDLWIEEPILNLSMRDRLINLLKFGFSQANLPFLKRLNRSNFMPYKFKKLIREQIDLKESISEESDFGEIPKKPLYKIFPNRCYFPVYGLDMFHKLQCSKVVLNKHSNPAKGTVDNMRLFQATGVGACLLTDTGDNLKELFEADREVITYSSINECIEKIKYLLNNEKLRKEVADAGQRRTLKDHNSETRYRFIDHLIQNIL